MKKLLILITLCALSCTTFATQTITLNKQEIQKMQQQYEKMAVTNQQAGEKFLAANAKQKDVVTLPDGLQYKVLTKGAGAKPKSTDSVTVNYEGSLIDGTVFDSSYKRGQPATFGVNQVIKGWTEALQLMPQGSTWMLYIPADLAYGARGAGQSIGPNETLIFKVELIDIN